MFPVVNPSLLVALLTLTPCHRLREDGYTGDPDIGQNPPNRLYISDSVKFEDLLRMYEAHKWLAAFLLCARENISLYFPCNWETVNALQALPKKIMVTKGTYMTEKYFIFNFMCLLFPRISYRSEILGEHRVVFPTR